MSKYVIICLYIIGFKQNYLYILVFENCYIIQLYIVFIFIINNYY